MGDWNTLHVFDDKKFYSEIVPRLKDEKLVVGNQYDELKLLNNESIIWE